MATPSPSKHERPSLPSSSRAFALPGQHGGVPGPLSLDALQASPFLLLRAGGSGRLAHRSPLAVSFAARGGADDGMALDTESPTPPESGGGTPPLMLGPLGPPADVGERARLPRRSSSRRNNQRSRSPSVSKGEPDFPPPPARRLSHTIIPVRIRSLMQEAHPEESELRSEAQFQRVLAAALHIPGPSTGFAPRAPSDRGRYPEEADTGEPAARASTPSDGSADAGEPLYGYEPIAISKPSTPAASVNGDEMPMSVMESPGLSHMELDMAMSSPTLAHASIASQWRHTPPPAASVIRPNKRKMTDSDRFDPYERTKRRAVSPSVHHLREHHRTPSHSRVGISLTIPGAPGSCASSPVAGPGLRGLASPTLRPSHMLASPILRPMSLGRSSARREEENEREISGAGSAVSGLTLG